MEVSPSTRPFLGASINPSPCTGSQGSSLDHLHPHLRPAPLSSHLLCPPPLALSSPPPSPQCPPPRTPRPTCWRQQTCSAEAQPQQVSQLQFKFQPETSVSQLKTSSDPVSQFPRRPNPHLLQLLQRNLLPKSTSRSQSTSPRRRTRLRKPTRTALPGWFEVPTVNCGRRGFSAPGTPIGRARVQG